MFIDTTIKPSRHDQYAKIGMTAVTLMLMIMMNVAWWQYVIVLMVAVGCLWLDDLGATPVHEMSVKAVDDVWYLGVYDESRREVWQAHLHEVTAMGRVLKLGFYVSVPFERVHHVIIRRDMVSEEDFCKLASLANTNGRYR